MPGRDDREPAPADRPPASRVADELAQRVEASTQGDHHPDERERAEAERQAELAAKRIQWDQAATAQERPATR